MFGDWMSWAFCVGDCRGRVPVLFRAIWTENRAAKIVGGAGTHVLCKLLLLYYYAVGALNSVNNNKKYYVSYVSYYAYSSSSYSSRVLL